MKEQPKEKGTLEGFLTACIAFSFWILNNLLYNFSKLTERRFCAQKRFDFQTLIFKLFSQEENRET